MNKYEKKIKQHINLKYQRSSFSSNFIKKYLKKINNTLDKSLNINNSYFYKKKLNNTEYFLFNKLNKKISLNNKKKIIIFFIKFNVNLKLKKSYNKNFIKLDNKNCHLRAYLFLGNLIDNVREISLLQKLNCLLKIYDLCSLNISKLNNYEKFLFKKIIINILIKLKKLDV
jgi:hypothetical protein